MLQQEFDKLVGFELKSESAFWKVNQAYLDSKSNKYDFTANLLKVFKDWIWENIDGLRPSTKAELLEHFIIYELDYYKDL